MVFGYRGHSYEANVDLPCRANSYHAIFTTVTVQTVATHYFNHRNRAAQIWLYQDVTVVLTYRGIIYQTNRHVPL